MTTDVREWFSAAAGRKITATEIADHLGVARNTANKRLADGLNASDIITISRAIDVNPVEALTDLDYLTLDEAVRFVDPGGKLLATADERDLVLELADRTLSPQDLAVALARRIGPGWEAARDRALTELERRRTQGEVSEPAVTVNLPGVDEDADFIDKLSQHDYDLAAHRSDEKGYPDYVAPDEGPQIDPNADDDHTA